MSRAKVFDPHGQPIDRLLNRKHRVDRDLDELLGLAKGLVADGVVNQAEGEFLEGWLRCNREVCTHEPILMLYNRVSEMLEDRLLDAEEQAELLYLLSEFTGLVPEAEVVENITTRLPFDHPAPVIQIQDRTFCFTGRFVSGTRRECEGVVIDRGGMIHPRIAGHVDYLVVGFFGSDDWAHTAFGRKIEAAMELQKKGAGIKIVSEDHWLSHVHGMKVGK